ncbi:beta-chimaerin [Sitodiplosis mosellana]|uniref:beta-chimaerin n=1 Tax=Sitodiplosis mosellana TaxID=263140 RepID=UPI0024451270|nr:beta-chimaerin [Sitodiplosis mosellana]
MSNGTEQNSPVHKVWKPELYKIQLEAPTPKALLRDDDIKEDSFPDYYGYEYHGVMDHKQSETLLNDKCDGSYIVRRSPGATDYYTLSLRFNNRTKHYKIYYKPNASGGHFLKEDFKRFDTIHDLVADGLVNFYMQIHAAPIIQAMMSQTKSSYQQSPYMTLNRRKLRALSNDLRKSLKYDNQPPMNDNVASITTSLTTALLTNSTETKATNAQKQNEENMNHLNTNGQSQVSIGADDIDVLPVVYQKSHKFKIHTFKGLNWCELCANFLWGFTAQGVKCEDCGFIAHNKCSELVPAKCVPDMKKIRGVFGSDLTIVVTLHQCTIPFVVRRCVEEVEARGMLQEGIYRVSGFADEIDALKLALDRHGEKTDMSESAYSNINVVAGTLKLYLRLLPVPLITYHAYPTFIQSTSCTSVGEQVIKMREAVKQLPPAHFNCLKFVIEHLNRVSSHHAVNKMTEHNIATVFAPTLIATPPHLTDLSQEIFVLTSLITHCQAVFMN